MMLQLKTGRLRPEYFRGKFGADILSAFAAGWGQLQNDGFLTVADGKIELTPRRAVASGPPAARVFRGGTSRHAVYLRLFPKRRCHGQRHYSAMSARIGSPRSGPSNTDVYIQEKLEEYFAINVRMVWLVAPEARCVHVYRSLTDIRTFKETDTLTGGDVLPGFEMPVAKIFENL